MKLSYAAITCCIALSVITATTRISLAKTVKACDEEWKANKSSIQAKGIKKKDFVASCRSESDTATPPAKRTSAPRSEPSSTGGQTAKACEEQWKANKPAIQASGKHKKDFIAECRAGVATNTTPTREDNRTTTTRSNSSKETSAPAREPTSPSSGTSTAANQYSSEGAAKIHCPLDTIVWVNTKSGIYHFAGHKDYGGTRMGAYMCEKDTASQGYRAAKNEKHP